MNSKLIIGAILGIFGLIWLKHKFDPHNDAFRTKERKGWNFSKAKVISLDDYRKRKNGS